jgi:high-affinity iron transporter
VVRNLLSQSWSKKMKYLTRGVCLVAIGLVFHTVASSAAVADVTEGKALYGARCASCHGASGAGDGPVAAALPADLKPRDLTSGAMKFATDDAKLKQVIKGGGGAVGLNAMMPGQADLSDAQIDSLIAFLKSIRK